jgi:hypothetical protein
MLFMFEKLNPVPRNLFMVLAVAMLSSTCALAGSFTIAPEQLGDLRDQRALLAGKVKELDNVSKQIVVAQANKRSAISSIRRLESENEQARAKLEKLQGFDRDNPGTISQEQLRAAEDQNRKAFSNLTDAKEKKSAAETKINALNVDASDKYAEFLRLQKSFERDVDRVVDNQLQERLRALQVKKEVTVTEKVPCGDDSIPVCKERSKKAAELKASETGSVVFVNSLTEVKNFKLSREEIRSEVQASLSNKVFSNQHMVGETEYETTITANVEPAIGDSLREQMANSIRSQVYDIVGGRIDFSQVQNPAQTADSGQDSEEVVLDRSPRSKKKKVVEVVEEQPAPQEVAPPPQPAPTQAPTRRRIEKPTFTF